MTATRQCLYKSNWKNMQGLMPQALLILGLRNAGKGSPVWAPRYFLGPAGRHWDPDWAPHFSMSSSTRLAHPASLHSHINSEPQNDNFRCCLHGYCPPYHWCFVLTWIHSLFSSSVLLKQKKNRENIIILLTIFSVNSIHSFTALYPLDF